MKKSPSPPAHKYQLTESLPIEQASNDAFVSNLSGNSKERNSLVFQRINT